MAGNMKIKLILSICLLIASITSLVFASAHDEPTDTVISETDLGITVENGRIYIDVKDAEIRQVLAEISRKAGIQLTMDEGIGGPISLKAEGVGIEEILGRLSESRALVFQGLGDDNSYRIVRIAACSGSELQDKESPSLPEESAAPSSASGKKTPNNEGNRKTYDSKGRLMYEPSELLVRFREGTTEEQIAGLNKSLGSRVIKRIDRLRLYRVRIKDGTTEEEAIERYQSSDLVDRVERHALRYAQSTTPNDRYFSDLWGLKKIKAREAWDITTGSSDIIIAVIDTGVDYTHPDLASNIWVNMEEFNGEAGKDDDSNGYIDDIYGWDFADGDNDPVPLPLTETNNKQDHGTHVAGIIAAEGNNSIGVAGFCWKAKILVLKVQPDRELYMQTFAIIDAMQYAMDNGARIVNCSFGGEGYDESEKAEIAKLMDADILTVCSAGNETSNNDTTPVYPASHNLDNIISVGASTDTESLASFSNYGPTSVDVMAPGVSIKSTIPAAAYTAASVTFETTTCTATGMAFAGITNDLGLTSTVLNCHLGYPDQFPDGIGGKIALIKKGELTFYEKVSNARDRGTAGVIIYNNEPEIFTGTLGIPGNWPPVVSISGTYGLALLELAIETASPVTATIVNSAANQPSSYGIKYGTSMAAPHVSGLAALILSRKPALSYGDVRSAIIDSVDKISSVSEKIASGGRINALASLQWVRINPGDISGDGMIGLDDAIMSVQIAVGESPPILADCLSKGADVNGDGKIGLEASIYVIQKVAGLR